MIPQFYCSTVAKSKTVALSYLSPLFYFSPLLKTTKSNGPLPLDKININRPIGGRQGGGGPPRQEGGGLAPAVGQQEMTIELAVNTKQQGQNQPKKASKTV